MQGASDAKEREQLFKAKARPDARGDDPEGTRNALAAVSSNAVYYVVNSPQPALTCAKIGDELNRMQVIWAQQNRPDPQTVQAKIESCRELATGSSNSNAGAIQVVTEDRSRPIVLPPHPLTDRLGV